MGGHRSSERANMARRDLPPGKLLVVVLPRVQPLYRRGLRRFRGHTPRPRPRRAQAVVGGGAARQPTSHDTAETMRAVVEEARTPGPGWAEEAATPDKTGSPFRQS